MREALARASPGNAELAQELGATLDSLGGSLTQTGNTAAAFETYGRTLEVRRKMVALDPHGVVPRRALATSYHHIAEALVDRGEYRQALSVWGKESELFETLWKENPADKRAQRNVALSYKYLGGTLERLGDRAEALDLYTRAVALDEARSAADPTRRGSICPSATERGRSVC